MNPGARADLAPTGRPREDDFRCPLAGLLLRGAHTRAQHDRGWHCHRPGARPRPVRGADGGSAVRHRP